jgi:hypothetical protein
MEKMGSGRQNGQNENGVRVKMKMKKMKNGVRASY